MKLVRTLLPAVLTCAIAACRPAPTNELVITGSSTVAPLVAELAAAFESQHPGWRIDVQSGGSSRGIRDVRQGLADAGMISRALATDEQDLITHTLAIDGIALIVHADNPLKSLSDDEIRRIYSGDEQTWSALGGHNRPITVINKAEGRATLKVFLAHIELDNRVVEADLIAGENQQVVETVARDPAAIGYVSIGTAKYEMDNGASIKLLLLAGYEATVANVQAGDYPLSRPLNLVTRNEPNEDLAAFMKFWRTPEATEIIQRHYFVPATE
ncbi:MAG: phosphate ABC transporter substrate-binding protein [Pseudomonadales bacterium]